MSLVRSTVAGRHCATSALLAGVLAIVVACGGSSDDPQPPAPAGSAGSQPPSDLGLANSGCTLHYVANNDAPRTGADPLLPSQWHLANDGRVTGTAGEDLRALAAWPTTRGEGVRVAVLDNAIEVTHDDLAPNVVAGASYDYRPASRGGSYPMPCTSNESHGTAVAGLASARDDDAVGGSGVAPRSALVGYNALTTGTTADLVDALNRALDGNSIYNNSWGSNDDGFLHPAPPSVETAIANGIEHGRGGKGVIYVFPSGNGGCYNDPDDPFTPGQCSGENSNYDGYVNQLGIITVCATDSSGRQPYYGERGANILVCAPSSGRSPASFVRTTALSDGYVNDFTGTSASTPMVSGVAALILAANPNLTWRDVRLILARTARRNDAADADWQPAGSLAFNPKYGFGVADAQAAVTAARTWTSVGGSESLLSCGPYSANVGTALPDLAAGQPRPVASAIDAAGCAIRQIEFVTVRFTATHPSSGDLRLRLRSPAGLVSELADARFCYDDSRRIVDCGRYDETRFGTVRHLDEPVVGAGGAVWTLEATDMVAQDQGSFVRWSIQFYGR
ncbi:MAG: S8 family serine peptidase [Burkholderiaceae bacterium]